MEAYQFRPAEASRSARNFSFSNSSLFFTEKIAEPLSHRVSLQGPEVVLNSRLAGPRPAGYFIKLPHSFQKEVGCRIAHVVLPPCVVLRFEQQDERCSGPKLC